MKKYKILITTVAFLLFAVIGMAQTKSPIKVMYVGFSEKDESLYRELLDRYFSNVTLMHAKDWKPADSYKQDVTIFGVQPNPIGKRMQNGREVTQYLPDDFNKPVILLSGTASVIGASLGLKTDWLCLCLLNDAHHINMSHPIFNGPLEKVKLTIKKKPAPAGIYEYPAGQDIPKQIPMWQVNDSSFHGFGMVSRGYDFAGSPDAEVISSGVCLKDASAVALGRHANYFLWGFAAGPNKMTEEARKVFVNVIAYMKQFDGQQPIVRKRDDFVATTAGIEDRASRCTKEWYDKRNDEYDKQVELWKVKADAAQKKKDIGQPLSEAEKQAVSAYQYSKSNRAWNSWDEFVRYTLGDTGFKRFGKYGYQIKKYIDANLRYMIADSVGYDFHVDADAQKLKISNHNPKILAKCINMLKKGEQTDLAKRILTRYTVENYQTADEWQGWFDKNKSKFFFTEAGGWKFLVNTIEEKKS